MLNLERKNKVVGAYCIRPYKLYIINPLQGNLIFEYLYPGSILLEGKMKPWANLYNPHRI